MKRIEFCRMDTVNNIMKNTFKLKEVYYRGCTEQEKETARNRLKELSALIEDRLKVCDKILCIKVDFTVPTTEMLANMLSKNGFTIGKSQREIFKGNNAINLFWKYFKTMLESEDRKEYVSSIKYEFHHAGFGWVREYGENGIKHYHGIITINGARNRSVGRYNGKPTLTQYDGFGTPLYPNLCNIIATCWLKALNLFDFEYASPGTFGRLIYFPYYKKNKTNKFNPSETYTTERMITRDFEIKDYMWLDNRLSYMSKPQTKTPLYEQIAKEDREYIMKNERSFGRTQIEYKEYDGIKNIEIPPYITYKDRERRKEMLRVIKIKKIEEKERINGWDFDDTWDEL